jgi:RNAse (barnase) inhibitor barstar
MDKFKAKNAFKRQKKFFTQLRNGHSAPDTFSKDQSRALLYLLHFLVVGEVPIKSVAFNMLESHYGIKKFRSKLETKKNFHNLLKSDLASQSEFLNNFKLVWSALVDTVLHTT